MNLPRVFLAAVLLMSSTLSFAAEVREMNSDITFFGQQSRVIRVTRTEQGRIYFHECHRGITPQGMSIENCLPIGSENGYSRTSIESRGRKLSALKWAKGLVVVPATMVCSTLLAGSLGSSAVINSLQNSNLNTDLGTNPFALIEMVSFEMGFVALATLAYGAIGTVGGLVAGFVVNQYMMPSLKQGAKAMLVASRKDDVPTLIVSGTIEEYRQTLERALTGLESE